MSSLLDGRTLVQEEVEVNFEDLGIQREWPTFQEPHPTPVLAQWADMPDPPAPEEGAQPSAAPSADLAFLGEVPGSDTFCLPAPDTIYPLPQPEPLAQWSAPDRPAAQSQGRGLARWMTGPRRRIAVGAGALAAVVAIVLVVRGGGAETAKVPALATTVVTRGPLALKVRAPGKVEPGIQAHIHSRLSGQVAQILVKPGQSVHKDDVLLRLEAAEYEREVERAGTDVDEKQAALDLVMRRRRSTIRGFADGTLPPGAVESLRNEVALAQARLKTAQLAQKMAEDKVRYTTIVAPFDGQVMTLNVAPGEAVTGVATATAAERPASQRPLLVLGDARELSVRTEVKAADVARAHTGQRARITLDPLPGQTFVGTVAAPPSSPPPANPTGSVPIDVQMMPAAGLASVTPGMTAQVEIEVAGKQDVLLLPVAAVSSEGGAKRVLVWSESDHKFQPRPVQTGDEDGRLIEIRSGVTEGMRVAANPPPLSQSKTN
jgi:RND family efflux transporter MFP subunit